MVSLQVYQLPWGKHDDLCLTGPTFEGLVYLEYVAALRLGNVLHKQLRCAAEPVLQRQLLPLSHASKVADADSCERHL